MVHWFCLKSQILFDGWVSYFQIMRECDPNLDLKMNTGIWSTWTIFHGLVIFLNIFKIIWWMNIIIGIMDQCDTKIDLIKYMFQDQDSLLVKGQNDNHSPGPVIRELVPSSHQRSELRTTVLCIFSRWDQRIGEGIPIPDSLGEEATFINIYISNGSLKCHRVLIPTMPFFGDKVISWYTGFTFKTFI